MKNVLEYVDLVLEVRVADRVWDCSEDETETACQSFIQVQAIDPGRTGQGLISLPGLCNFRLKRPGDVGQPLPEMLRVTAAVRAADQGGEVLQPGGNTGGMRGIANIELYAVLDDDESLHEVGQETLFSLAPCLPTCISLLPSAAEDDICGRADDSAEFYA